MALDPINIPGVSDYDLLYGGVAMVYEPRVGDVYVGYISGYDEIELRLYFGGTEKTPDGFEVPVVYFAGGLQLGSKMEARQARNVRAKRQVGRIGVEDWRKLEEMPLEGRYAQVEDLLSDSQRQEQNSGGFWNMLLSYLRR